MILRIGDCYSYPNDSNRPPFVEIADSLRRVYSPLTSSFSRGSGWRGIDADWSDLSQPMSRAMVSEARIPFLRTQIEHLVRNINCVGRGG